MIVKELILLLDPVRHGAMEVMVRCNWHGEAPADPRFEISYVAAVLEPDTAEEVVVIECRQDGS